MCGIFAYLGSKKNAAELTLAALKTLEYRGYDSWGIAVKSKVQSQKLKVEVEKHISKIGEAHTSLGAASLAIGHTRWATHGGVTDANAHPHLNTAKTIAVVHNGIVENYQELKAQLIESGVVFESQTDTEVIAHLIDQKVSVSKSFKDAVLQTFRDLVGSNAIVAMDVRAEEVVACRDGSPLVVGVSDDELLLASDVTALLPYTRQVYFLRDGETVHLSHVGASIYETKTGAAKKLELETIDWSVETAQKGAYRHFTLKEIVEQSVTIPRALKLNDEAITQLATRIPKASRIVVTGCGTAYHCALIAKYFFAHAGIAVDAIPANELLPFISLLDDRSIVIAISQSGETADTLIAVKAAQARGATLVAVVNARSSTLERLANTVLSVGSGPEIGVVSTKAFTAQTATMYNLACACHPDHGSRLSTDDLRLTLWLSPTLLKSIEDIAAQLLISQDIYVVGKYDEYPVALETALKIKEASYIHAEGFACGELKHGVISLIQKGTPCIVVANEDEVKREVLSSATELKTRGGLIIGISPEGAPEYDIHIPTLRGELLTPLTNAIVGQLLGYYLSVGRGLDPDKPRNLAKSVTVK